MEKLFPPLVTNTMQSDVFINLHNALSVVFGYDHINATNLSINYKLQDFKL